MSDQQIAAIRNVVKVFVAFVNAFAGVIAAYPGPELPPLVRLGAAAVVGGCGAVLLMVNPPGSEVTVAAIADELEARQAERTVISKPPAWMPREEVRRG